MASGARASSPASDRCPSCVVVSKSSASGRAAASAAHTGGARGDLARKVGGVRAVWAATAAPDQRAGATNEPKLMAATASSIMISECRRAA